MKRLNRIILSVLVVLMLCISLPSKAQIFICDDEFEGTQRMIYEDYQLVVPLNALDDDQYTPLGEGLVLLVGMGSAYLLSKREKRTD